MERNAFRLPGLTAGDDNQYADHTLTGMAADAANVIAAGGPAPLTSFGTVAQAAHLNPDDGFGIIGHDLAHPSHLHRHDYMEITHAIAGTVLVWVEGETNVLTQGGTILIKPGARHLISPIIEYGQTPHEADILIKPELIRQCRIPILEAAGADRMFISWLDDDRQTHCLLAAGKHHAGEAAISRMFIAYCINATYRPDFTVIGNLLELFHETSRVLEHQPRTDPLIAAIIETITADPATAHNQAIADTLGYSVGYLSRYARKHSGHTLGQLINEERLRLGAELLVTTDDTIAEITRTIGYESPAYFHKLFRSRYLITPDRYRNDFRIALRCG